MKKKMYTKGIALMAAMAMSFGMMPVLAEEGGADAMAKVAPDTSCFEGIVDVGDQYVAAGSENVDFLDMLEVNEDIVTGITVETDTDFTSEGVFPMGYIFTTDEEALEAFLTAGNVEEPFTIEDFAPFIVDVDGAEEGSLVLPPDGIKEGEILLAVDASLHVVNDAEGQELANKGITVHLSGSGVILPEEVMSGLTDQYVLQGSSNVDYSFQVEARHEEIAKLVKVEAPDVNEAETGEYKVAYTVEIDKDRLDEYLDDMTEAADAEEDDSFEMAEGGMQELLPDSEPPVEPAEIPAEEDAAPVSEEPVMGEGSNPGTDTPPADEAVSEPAPDALEAEDAPIEEVPAKEDTAPESTVPETTEGIESNKEDEPLEGSSVVDGLPDDAEAGDAVSTEEAAETPEETPVTLKIIIEKIIEVVDETRAQELADEGVTVWTDNNEKVEPAVKEEVPAVTEQTVVIEETKTETKPAPTAAPAKEEEPAHTHNWVPVKETVHHEAEGHYEKKQTGTQKVQTGTKHHDAVTHEEAVYEEQPIIEGFYVCNGCGARMKSGIGEHTIKEDCGYHGEEIQTGTKTVQVGTRTVVDQEAYDEPIYEDQPVYEDVWVVDKAAWDEEVVIGYRCNECGATK